MSSAGGLCCTCSRKLLRLSLEGPQSRGACPSARLHSRLTGCCQAQERGGAASQLFLSVVGTEGDLAFLFSHLWIKNDFDRLRFYY